MAVVPVLLVGVLETGNHLRHSVDRSSSATLVAKNEEGNEYATGDILMLENGSGRATLTVYNPRERCVRIECPNPIIVKPAYDEDSFSYSFDRTTAYFDLKTDREYKQIALRVETKGKFRGVSTETLSVAFEEGSAVVNRLQVKIALDTGY
ncbi:hypothetical protein [Haloarchaeobius sp. DFWS5]|uniref:hypothetical protein n=1 Tax=Haloarchaeobius sp. DFWS5 TaxID=3446114 RepID=UPI003EB7F069